MQSLIDMRAIGMTAKAVRAASSSAVMFHPGKTPEQGKPMMWAPQGTGQGHWRDFTPQSYPRLSEKIQTLREDRLTSPFWPLSDTALRLQKIQTLRKDRLTSPFWPLADLSLSATRSCYQTNADRELTEILAIINSSCYGLFPAFIPR